MSDFKTVLFPIFRKSTPRRFPIFRKSTAYPLFPICLKSAAFILFPMFRKSAPRYLFPMFLKSAPKLRRPILLKSTAARLSSEPWKSLDVAFSRSSYTSWRLSTRDSCWSSLLSWLEVATWLRFPMLRYSTGSCTARCLSLNLFEKYARMHWIKLGCPLQEFTDRFVCGMSSWKSFPAKEKKLLLMLH